MCQALSAFTINKYVHLDGFLDKDSCAQLANELKMLVTQKATHKDDQCPLSEAIHGAPVFDSLLEQLVPNFEVACGKKLYPTYAYARLYQPGEELAIHTDRPSCEISATLTLGYEGDIWPIYMGHNEDKSDATEVKLEVGDAVLYRGCDVYHWREKYTQGKWLAQVFLHYVDADGPYAEHKYDKRGRLAHHKENVSSHQWIAISDAFPPEACKKLIDSCEAQTKGEKAQIGSGDMGVINTDIRDVNRVSLPVYRGIGATMAGIGLLSNKQYWNFDITHANQCDYLRYDENGHYQPHVDTFIQPGNMETRKLTVLAFLNDDFEGGKLFIQDGHERYYPPQDPGTVIIFPSFLTHGVEPVTKGVRRSIVTWLVGPWFK